MLDAPRELPVGEPVPHPNAQSSSKNVVTIGRPKARLVFGLVSSPLGAGLRGSPAGTVAVEVSPRPRLQGVVKSWVECRRPLGPITLARPMADALRAVRPPPRGRGRPQAGLEILPVCRRLPGDEKVLRLPDRGPATWSGYRSLL